MAAARLKNYLDSQRVKYTSITHSLGYTAQEIASVAHIPGREVAKTVMVYADDRLVMAVVPASLQVSLSRLRDAIGASTVTLASEREFREAFPDCETGAMPPFGNLYNLAVYMDESLLADREIAFNAGTHRELIRLSYDDFERLVHPKVASFAAPRYELAGAR